MSLYELERDGDVQELIRVLEDSGDPEIRARAAEFLASFEDHEYRRDVVNALVDAARDDTDKVAAAAIDALADFGGDAIQKLVSGLADVELNEDSADWVKAEAYVDALDADVPELRMAAATGLGELESTEGVEALTDTFDDADPRVRARAARACGWIDDPRATDPLENLLADEFGAVRREAADALGRLGSRQALEALLGLYADDDERIRRIAVGAFGKFDTDRPVEYLVDALTDEALTVRQAAVYSLVELLSNVPTDRSHEIREAVVETLSARDDPSVVLPLVEIVEEGTQLRQRRNTAWLLGRVTGDAGRERVIEALVTALRDADDPMVRQFAATSLAELGGETVEELLLPIVTDEDEPVDVRAQAVFTLGKVGGEEARQVLDSLIEETEADQVRKKAFAAISKLGGRE